MNTDKDYIKFLEFNQKIEAGEKELAMQGSFLLGIFAGVIVHMLIQYLSSIS